MFDIKVIEKEEKLNSIEIQFIFYNPVPGDNPPDTAEEDGYITVYARVVPLKEGVKLIRLIVSPKM